MLSFSSSFDFRNGLLWIVPLVGALGHDPDSGSRLCWLWTTVPGCRPQRSFPYTDTDHLRQGLAVLPAAPFLLNSFTCTLSSLGSSVGDTAPLSPQLGQGSVAAHQACSRSFHPSSSSRLWCILGSTPTKMGSLDCLPPICNHALKHLCLPAHTWFPLLQRSHCVHEATHVPSWPCQAHFPSSLHHSTLTFFSLPALF